MTSTNTTNAHHRVVLGQLTQTAMRFDPGYQGLDLGVFLSAPTNIEAFRTDAVLA